MQQEGQRTLQPKSISSLSLLKLGFRRSLFFPQNSIAQSKPCKTRKIKNRIDGELDSILINQDFLKYSIKHTNHCLNIKRTSKRKNPLSSPTHKLRNDHQTQKSIASVLLFIHYQYCVTSASNQSEHNFKQKPIQLILIKSVISLYLPLYIMIQRVINLQKWREKSQLSWLAKKKLNVSPVKGNKNSKIN